MGTVLLALILVAYILPIPLLMIRLAIILRGKP
jgi:hypothetical protein